MDNAPDRRVFFLPKELMDPTSPLAVVVDRHIVRASFATGEKRILQAL